VPRRRRTFKVGGNLVGWLANQDAVVGMQCLAPDCTDLVFSDPPFGLAQMIGGKIEKAYNRKKENVIDGYTEVHPDHYAHFTDQWVKEAYRVLRPGGTLWVMSGWTHSHTVQGAILKNGFSLLNKAIWHYNFGVWTTRKLVTSHYEMFLACKPPDRLRTFNRLHGNAAGTYTRGMRQEDYQWRQDVWVMKRDYAPGRLKNITKLPVPLVRKVIEMTTDPGDVILDPFVGNGTTYVAGMPERTVIGFEVNRQAYAHASEEARRALAQANQ